MTRIGQILAPGALTVLRAELTLYRLKMRSARDEALRLLRVMETDRQADFDDKTTIARLREAVAEECEGLS